MEEKEKQEEQEVTVLTVLLVGSVCAGKSTLVSGLVSHIRSASHNIHIWVVEYDDVVLKLSAEAASSNCEEASGEFKRVPVFEPTHWRAGRAMARHFTESLLLHTSNNGSSNVLREDFSSIATHYPPLQTPNMSTEQERHIIFLDDNMYYRSMRRAFYQLSLQYNSAFAQIFVDVSRKTALSRNSARNKIRSPEEKIPDSVLCGIADVLEPPMPSSNKWEKHTVTIVSEEENIVSEGGETNPFWKDFHRIWEHLEAAWKDPPLSNHKVLSEEEKQLLEKRRVASREANLQSAVKTADGTLRKALSERMKRIDVAEKKKYGKRLNECRRNVLKELRSKIIHLRPNAKRVCVALLEAKQSEGSMSTFERKDASVIYEFEPNVLADFALKLFEFDCETLHEK
eukprot:g5347.t1